VAIADERKIDQVVNKLGRYKVDVAVLQKTKWFGEGIYNVGESPLGGLCLLREKR